MIITVTSNITTKNSNFNCLPTSFTPQIFTKCVLCTGVCITVEREQNLLSTGTFPRNESLIKS